MVAQDTAGTDVLLPPATVEIFALNDRLCEAGAALSQDWRFARVAVAVERMAIESAISRYAEYTSPDLVIIETEDISDAFVTKLEQLAGNCSAGTEAIVVGPTNDVHVYRKLIDMGVRDYLVSPIPQDDLAAIMAKIILTKKGLSSSRLVAVLGSKGGVGATSVAQMLGWSISQVLKQKTLMLDAGGGWGSLGIGFGVEPTVTLAEGMRIAGGGSDDDLKRTMSNVRDNLFMTTMGGDSLLRDAADPEGFEQILNRVMATYPVVIVDLSGGTPAGVRERIVARAQDVVLVTEATLLSMRNARSILNELRAMKGGKVEGVDVVINKLGLSTAHEISKSDIKTALDVEPAAVIPFEPKIFLGCESGGKALGEEKTAEAIMRFLLPVAEHAAACKEGGKGDEKKGDGKAGSSPSLLSDIMDKFKKKTG